MLLYSVIMINYNLGDEKLSIPPGNKDHRQHVLLGRAERIAQPA